jgi:uncharacterized repeat protein (TIGR03803 family)
MTRRSLLFFFVSIVLFASQVAMAQTFHSIYIFSGPDGQSPSGMLASDQGGNLYGSTQIGGSYQLGNVYKLSQRNAQWRLTPLRSFGGQNFDPAYPSGVIRDASGVLYGASNAGGSTGGGTLFTLRPSARPAASVISPWNETTLYTFLTNDPDGYRPGYGSLVGDQHGNLFGTTTASNTTCGCGVVYEASPSGNGWTETIRYAFLGGTNDGAGPQAGVVMDAVGNLYGTTVAGEAENCGVVYRLAPSGSGYTESVIHSFAQATDGCAPWAGITLDADGNLYGATSKGGSQLGGTVFQLSPSNGGWTYNVLHSFSGMAGPIANLTFNASGNLYGTTSSDGAYGHGSVFQLTQSNGSWTFISLYDFTCGLDGCDPSSGVTIDSSGNLFGTTSSGGVTDTYCDIGCGVVWEITP